MTSLRITGARVVTMNDAMDVVDADLAIVDGRVVAIGDDVGHAHLPATHVGGDWIIQRHVLREHGVVVTGPPLDAMIDPVSPDAIRATVRELVHGWWASMLDDSTFLQPDAYQVFAVLTMCRALHTLETGAIDHVDATDSALRWLQALSTLRFDRYEATAAP